MHKCIICDVSIPSSEKVCSIECSNNYTLLLKYNKKFSTRYPMQNKQLIQGLKLTKGLESIDTLLHPELSIQDKSDIFGFKTMSNISYYFYTYKKLYYKFSDSSLWLDKDRLDSIIIKDYERKKYAKKLARRRDRAKVSKKSTKAIDIKARDVLTRFGVK